MSILSLENVSVNFGKKDNVVHALKNINLSIEEGEFVAITGKSGCGKTTLLNVLGKVLEVDSGKYFFEEQDVTHLNDSQSAIFRNSKIGFIVQHFALVQDMTVFQNIALPLKYNKVKKKEIVKKVEELLALLEISDKKDKYPYELSGGQCQRVAIARALVNEPKVILADEPTGALDEETGNHIFEILKKWNEKNIAIVLVTHDMELAEQARRIIRIKDGKII